MFKKTFLLYTLFLFLSPPALSNQCMSRDEIKQLNKEIVCQQLWNPEDCFALSEYLDQDRYYVDQMETEMASAPNGSYTAAAGAAAVVFRADRPVVAAFMATRNKIQELNQLLLRATNMTEISTQFTSQVASKIDEVRAAAGNRFRHVSQSFTRVNNGALRTALSRMSSSARLAGRIASVGGRVALNTIGRAAMPIAVASLIYELDQIYVNRVEQRTGCTAAARNAADFWCVTETCRLQMTFCPKAFNFAISNDPDMQALLLDSDPQLCSYMQQTLNLSRQQFNSVTLHSCPTEDGGSAQLRVDNFQFADISSSIPDRQYPDVSSTTQLDMNINFLDWPEEMTPSRIRSQLQPSMHDINNYDFRYNAQGDLAVSYFSRDSYPIRQPNTNYQRLTPARNAGFFASFGNTNRASNFADHQSFFLHKRTSQIYGEVLRCCHPNFQGQNCRLHRPEARTGDYDPHDTEQ